MENDSYTGANTLANRRTSEIALNEVKLLQTDQIEKLAGIINAAH